MLNIAIPLILGFIAGYYAGNKNFRDKVKKYINKKKGNK